MIRAGTLHTIQQRLAGDAVLQPGSSSSGGGSKRQRGYVGGPKHVPLLLRAKEPAVEERLLKLAAARGPVAPATALQQLAGTGAGGDGIEAATGGAGAAAMAGAAPASEAACAVAMAHD